MKMRSAIQATYGISPSEHEKNPQNRISEKSRRLFSAPNRGISIRGFNLSQQLAHKPQKQFRCQSVTKLDKLKTEPRPARQDHPNVFRSLESRAQLTRTRIRRAQTQFFGKLLPEQELILKYKHVYAGRGAWLDHSKLTLEPQYPHNGTEDKFAHLTIAKKKAGIDRWISDQDIEISNSTCSSLVGGIKISKEEENSSVNRPEDFLHGNSANERQSLGDSSSEEIEINKVHNKAEDLSGRQLGCTTMRPGFSGEIKEAMESIHAGKGDMPPKDHLDVNYNSVKLDLPVTNGNMTSMSSKKNTLQDKSQISDVKGKQSRLSVFSRMSYEAQCAISETRKEMLENQSTITDVVPERPDSTDNGILPKDNEKVNQNTTSENQEGDKVTETDDMSSVRDFLRGGKAGKELIINAPALTQRGQYFSHKILTKETPISTNIKLKPQVQKCHTHRTTATNKGIHRPHQPAKLDYMQNHTKSSPRRVNNLPLTHLMREKTFQITPMGYDCRFALPVRDDAIDDTPEEVKDKARLKCSEWLKKYM